VACSVHKAESCDLTKMPNHLVSMFDNHSRSLYNELDSTKGVDIKK